MSDREGFDALIAAITGLLKPPLRIVQQSGESPRRWAIERADNPHEFAACVTVAESKEDNWGIKIAPTAEGAASGPMERRRGALTVYDQKAAQTIVQIAECYLTDDPAAGPDEWLAAGLRRRLASQLAKRGKDPMTDEETFEAIRRVFSGAHPNLLLSLFREKVPGFQPNDMAEPGS
jgi:hypothetical protein